MAPAGLTCTGMFCDDMVAVAAGLLCSFCPAVHCAGCAPAQMLPRIRLGGCCTASGPATRRVWGAAQRLALVGRAAAEAGRSKIRVQMQQPEAWLALAAF